MSVQKGSASFVLHIFEVNLNLHSSHYDEKTYQMNPCLVFLRRSCLTHGFFHLWSFLKKNPAKIVLHHCTVVIYLHVPDMYLHTPVNFHVVTVFDWMQFRIAMTILRKPSVADLLVLLVSATNYSCHWITAIQYSINLKCVLISCGESTQVWDGWVTW